MAISLFASMGGVSGAFLLLPFQVSVLGFTTPAVTPTNLLFNVVGIPSGVYRYFQEGRMAWPLAWNIIVGTFPGLFVGGVIRVRVLPDPEKFKLFMAVVLLYIGVRMLYLVMGPTLRESRRSLAGHGSTEPSRLPGKTGMKPHPDRNDHRVRTISWSIRRTVYEYQGQRYSYSTWGLFVLSLVVGVIGGTYGIGGGAIMAPIIVNFFGLPIHTIAGATLMGTCVTSVGGVIFYSLMGRYLGGAGVPITPDWLLGILFGIGGIAGMYLGASLQRFVPDTVIRFCLGALIVALGVRYAIGYLW
jgi:hypothetical protein